MGDATRILANIEAGDPHAAEQLLPLVYDELRRLARAKLSHEKPGQTLQATALVHEAYLRLVGCESERGRQGEQDTALPLAPSSNFPLSFSSRGHFFAAAAEAMRRILIDAARRKGRQKRGGGMDRLPLEESAIAAPDESIDLIELDAALQKLEQKDSRKAALVELRYFAGLTQQQAAEALGISVATADRDWAYARAWLLREMGGGSARG
jgi:RNA polymerase sigma factor (sigma-70 family)